MIKNENENNFADNVPQKPGAASVQFIEFFSELSINY